MINSELVLAAIGRKMPLPNPSQIATNILRYVGDRTADTAMPIETLAPDFRTTVGAINLRSAFQILSELKSRGLLNALFPPGMDVQPPQEVELTLVGWNEYEAEQKGQFGGSYGFIALKFNDPTLDPFVADHVKPAIAELGYELRDMRDVAKAGLIDNLMRVEIRDAAFVIVDLTHDNPGAYWEAGYAEGLGKPVLYICEKSKFDAKGTHFDTSHCTTVPWEATAPDEFKAQLKATLQRSLHI